MAEPESADRRLDEISARVTRELATLERERVGIATDLTRRLEILESRLPGADSWTAEQVKEILDADRQTLEAQVDRRIHAAERAVEVASDEREKSAAILREQLGNQIDQGDQSLRNHITQQFEQYRIMLEALRREVELISDEQAKAISKAESATDKRFHSVNELRSQLQDLINSHQKALADLTATLMPREVAEAKFAEQGNKIDANTSRLDRSTGKETGAAGVEQRADVKTSTIISAIAAAVAVLGTIIVAASFLA